MDIFHPITKNFAIKKLAPVWSWHLLIVTTSKHKGACETCMATEGGTAARLRTIVHIRQDIHNLTEGQPDKTIAAEIEDAHMKWQGGSQTDSKKKQQTKHLRRQHGS